MFECGSWFLFLLLFECRRGKFIVVGLVEKEFYLFLLCEDEDLGFVFLCYLKDFGGFLCKIYRKIGV